MTRFGRVAAASAILTLVLWGGAGRTAARAADRLPDRISDADFWKLTESLSEPDGFFHSDNLLSNEMVFARIVPDLAARVKPGGVYLGVGPEQNFTYIATTQPKIAFIIDIRRGNMLLQLMYKAIFELSADRADFIALLFNKPRPPGLTRESAAGEIMSAYWNVPTSGEPEYRRNLQRIEEQLTRAHKMRLSAKDLDGIEYVYHAFYWFGPSITWSSSSSGTSAGRSYAEVVSQGSSEGADLSFLASEERFAFVRSMEMRNLIVPVVGNFAGPAAVRAVGHWLKSHGAVVSAFYLSNVEQYLRQDNAWSVFCANAASLPLDDESVFIRPSGAGGRVTVASSANIRVLLNGAPTPVMVAPPVPPAAAFSPPPALPPLGYPFGNIRTDTLACTGIR